ncbi:MAG: CPBP family intramembrane metalloprotease [Erysipelotrichaceae bacterium]|jgi:membrane protease YdiL (CAAX protease family)|nr:CPBP family intramembrane metalloprotease [Erysipelotrichaceae bacterium]
MLSSLLKSLSTVAVNLVFFVGLPSLWWLLVARKKNPSYAKYFGLFKPKLKMAFWVLIAFIALYLFDRFFLEEFVEKLIPASFLASEEGAAVVAQPTPAYEVPAILLTTVIGNGFCEEFLFRGFILKRLKTIMPTMLAIILTAVGFGLMHNILYLVAGVDVPWQFHLAAVFFGPAVGALFCGFLNEKIFNGSIIPSILLHGLNNAVFALLAVVW